MLPAMKHRIDDSPVMLSHASSSGSMSDQSELKKRKRLGKGSNILPLVRKMLVDQENWKTVSDKRDYHFLGAFPGTTTQQLYYIPDCKSLQQASTSNHHYMWNDIQLSKGHMKKDRLIK